MVLFIPGGIHKSNKKTKEREKRGGINAWPVVALVSLYARRRLVILAFIIVLRPVITRGRGDPRYEFAVVTRRDERATNPAKVIRARLRRVKRDAPRVAPRGVIGDFSASI